MAMWYKEAVLQVMAVYNDAHKLGGGGRGLSLHVEGLAGDACSDGNPQICYHRRDGHDGAQGTLE
jgi:hypothetical protein